MSDDLVKQLRSGLDNSDGGEMGGVVLTMNEAADRIEQLEAQVRAADALVQKGSTLALRLAHIVGREDIIIVWDQALKAYRVAREADT